MTKIFFDNIHEYIVPMEDFPLAWRFTEENYNVLPDIDLQQLKPLSASAARFLWNYFSDIQLYKDFPFNKSLFASEEMLLISDDKVITRNWLLGRNLKSDEPVFISWNSDIALLIPWNLLVKYFDDFFYPASDDVIVLNSNSSRVLLYHHTNVLYWGE